MAGQIPQNLINALPPQFAQMLNNQQFQPQSQTQSSGTSNLQNSRTMGVKRIQRYDAAPLSKEGGEMQMLLWAFGDVPNSMRETRELLEDMMLEYINDLCLEALRNSRPKPKVKVDDYLAVLRKDVRKFARSHQMLAASKDIKAARDVNQIDPIKSRLKDD
ncbi:hypothetical protein M427DRAFT_108326 [Gonapodya prolifera JEL478]|uniref:Transcription initiation factor TFIID subunit 13 n=1 Tax=Gonapodya prolifera (strain JEL478) TaxID=1344416 RepID=A0A139ATT7_GONPJ|nr:hypothetical protein M427DRAFT_108326 [Gonapodya prolifera JEL478]|eukprot:KXS20142.1 hypothetical protein M427DRAFT_108326 [Gonapodya prolifera JEL478]